MASLEVRPHADRQELQNSSYKQGESSYFKRKKKKFLASAILIGALGFGANAGVGESFSHQTVTASPISSSETAQLREDLSKMLEKKGLLGDRQKPLPVEIITFNTGSGNPKIKTPQKEFVNLPFYQKVIKGEPDAPIIGLQEAGPAQVKELYEATKNTNNASFEYIKSKFSKGGNLLIIPKRFDVIESKSSPYSAVNQIKGVVASLGDSDFDPSQIWPRMYSEMKLRDSLSGKVFTVFNTHLSYVNDIQDEQAEELFAGMSKAKKEGPVILMGDLNDNNYLPAEVGRLTEKIRAVGLSDMGPTSPPKNKTNIDYILASGTTPIKKEYLYGLSLPSSPTADLVSDHYAEADVIQFDK